MGSLKIVVFVEVPIGGRRGYRVRRYVEENGDSGISK